MLEDERHNTGRTRSQRLAAIHSLFRHAALGHPEHAALIARVLAIRPRKPSRKTVSWLTGDEADALLAAPDPGTWTGRRDRLLMLLMLTSGNPARPGNFVFTARGTARKMSADAVAERIKIHAAAASAACPGIAAKTVSPHVLRHSFAMGLPVNPQASAGRPSPF